MTRSALVSAGGDIFLTMMVYQMFKRHFYNEIDRMYICFNTEMDRSFVPEMFSKLSIDPKVSVVYHPYQLGWGEPIRQLVQVSREDLVLLLEDDFFIFTPGVVDGYFKRIESGECDLLGSPRYGTGEIAEAAKEMYNLDYSGMGDRGFGWWPTGFYCKRSDLLKTDQQFGSTKYNKGQYYVELGHTMSEDAYTDTFTWASIQLRYMQLKSIDIPQFHASPYEMKDRDNRVGNWIEGRRPLYLHGGSLSSGYSYNGFLLGRQPIPDNINALHEIETRVAFWKLCSDYVEGFDEFKIKYREGIQNLIINNKLDEGLIRTKYNIYRELMQL